MNGSLSKKILISNDLGHHTVAQNFKKAGTMYKLINDCFTDDVKIKKNILKRTYNILHINVY